MYTTRSTHLTLYCLLLECMHWKHLVATETPCCQLYKLTSLAVPSHIPGCSPRLCLTRLSYQRSKDLFPCYSAQRWYGWPLVVNTLPQRVRATKTSPATKSPCYPMLNVDVPACMRLVGLRMLLSGRRCSHSRSFPFNRISAALTSDHKLQPFEDIDTTAQTCLLVTSPSNVVHQRPAISELHRTSLPLSWAATQSNSSVSFYSTFFLALVTMSPHFSLLQITNHPKMSAIPPSSPRSARRMSLSQQRLKLIADMVASDSEDLSTIPHVLTGAHSAHYQTSLARHAVVILAIPPAGFAPDPAQPTAQWPAAANFQRMLRQPKRLPPLQLLASALQGRISPLLPASWEGAEFAFAPHNSPYLTGNPNFKPSTLFALHIFPPPALQAHLHPNNPYKLTTERDGLEMAVAAALHSTPLLQFGSDTHHPMVQQIQDMGGLPFVAYAPPSATVAKREQARSVVLTITSRGLSTSTLLTDPVLTHIFLSRTAAACVLKACSPDNAGETFLQHNRTTELLELLDILPQVPW
jgi:hypothetical protein